MNAPTETTEEPKNGVPLSVIDTHQLGAAFGGHEFFAHNRSANDTAHLVTGTWTVNLPTHVYHVLAHVPSTGGTTTSAHYAVTANDGSVTNRVVNQYTQQDQWAGVGFFTLGSNAKVTLKNVTDDGGLGRHDVAWDALAFVPVNGTLVTHTFDAVSLFAPNQDLNTNVQGIVRTPFRNMTTLHDWAIQFTHGGRKWNDTDTAYPDGITAKPACTGRLSTACVGGDVWQAADGLYQDARDANTTTDNHLAAGASEPKWLGFANGTAPKDLGAGTFDDDHSYKIKTEVAVSFVKANGNVVPGSADSHVQVRTGTTTLAPFIEAFMSAMQQDYGITPPNLSYSEFDANSYSGDATPVNATQDGRLPGRAYVPHFDQPQVSGDGSCVVVKGVSGGSIGYRPIAAVPAVDSSVNSWADRVTALGNGANPSAPASLGVFAHEIYNAFFNQGTIFATLFKEAPPIWQQINAKLCVDGSVASTLGVDDGDHDPVRGLAEAGYMPNLYLYLDGSMINDRGQPTTVATQVGDYKDFTNIPGDGNIAGNAYGQCSYRQRGNGGNPWGIGALESAGTRPTTVAFCDVDPPVFYGNPFGF